MHFECGGVKMVNLAGGGRCMSSLNPEWRGRLGNAGRTPHFNYTLTTEENRGV